MEVNTLLEQLLFVTVRISTITKSGQAGLGTGFVYSFEYGHGTGLVLVTNKHVIKDADTAELHFIGAGADGKPLLGHDVSIKLSNAEQAFVGHPDPDIDVAAMPLGGVLSDTASKGHPAFYRAVSDALIATATLLDDYEPIEPVTFVGYPNGLYDSASLLPIVRRGHSATALNVDYQNKPIFLIDASVFPGSSGSPVFLISPASAPDKHGNITLGAPSKLLFLGVVSAVYHRNVPVLTTATSAPFVQDMLDIGIVYKATTVDELARHLVSISPPSS